MKLSGKYSLNPPRGKKKRRKVAKNPRKKNPLPFTAIVANPGKTRRAKKPGMWVAKKPTRNPTKRPAKKRRNPSPVSRPLSVRSTAPIRRSVGANAWHHKRGTYVYNPKARKKKRRAINPVTCKNPMKKSRRRRGKGRSRNPVTRRGGARRRSSGRRRNSHRRRNPIPMVRELFPVNTLAVAGSAVVGGVVINTVINKLSMPTATRPWVLPGINIAMLGSQDPAVRATYYRENSLKLALYKGAAGAVIGWALRNQAPRLSYGFALGGFIAAGNDALKSMNVVTPDGTLRLNSGVGRNFSARPGAGYLPGTPTMFTNPAQQFLARRPGAGAAVVPGTTRVIERQTEGAFTGAN
jgi:hypothetical protein